MRLVLAVLLSLSLAGAAEADPTVDTACGNCSSSAIDGGCVVRPGVGSLVSMGMVIGALAIARRTRSHDAAGPLSTTPKSSRSR